MKKPLFYISPIFKHSWSLEWHEIAFSRDREAIHSVVKPTITVFEIQRFLSGEFGIGFFSDKKTKILSNVSVIGPKLFYSGDEFHIKWQMTDISIFNGLNITPSDLHSILSARVQMRIAKTLCSRRIGLVRPSWEIT